MKTFGGKLALGAAVAAALWIAPASAGVVQTAAGRREGKVTVAPAGLVVDGKVHNLADVLLVRFHRPYQTLRQPSVVRLVNGEVWRGRIVGLQGGRVKISSPLLGLREADAGEVACLEFRANLPALRDPATQTLYRDKGEPLPGELIWVNEEQVAVDSLLGALPLPRSGVRRYVMAREEVVPLAPDEAEVAFLDGTVLRGKLTLGKDKVTVAHRHLGRIEAPAAAVRSIVRRLPGVSHLTDLPYRLTVALPLSAKKVSGAPLGEGEGPARRRGGYLRSLTVLVGSEFQYTLPASDKSVRLLGALGRMPGGLGDARVEILAEGKTVLDQTIAPSQHGDQRLSVDLGKAKTFTIRVTFGRRLRFPCGVTFGDPILVRK